MEATETRRIMTWCSFCGISAGRARLLAGHYVRICPQCVGSFSKLLELREQLEGPGAAREVKDADPSLPSRKGLPHPRALIESAIQQFEGRGLTHEELVEVAGNAYQRGIEEFTHSLEPPIEVYVRHRMNEEIRRALPRTLAEDGT